MPRLLSRGWSLVLTWVLASGVVGGEIWCHAAPSESKRGMVATVHPLATKAGVAALEKGGNAVDAAIAAALTLGVVDSHNSGIGGSALLLIRTADGKLVAIDGREMAPAKAHRDMFLKDGKADAEASQTGPLAVATPGVLAAYQEALQHFGKRSLADALRPAAQIAEDGFPLDRNFAGNLSRTAATLSKFAGSRAALLKPDGKPYGEGEILRQLDLARTYRAIADDGIDWFYRGPFAQKVGAWMAENGGILTAADFAAYRTKRRDPLVTSYRGYTIVGFPPPSSGGVHVAQMLNMLEGFDLRGLAKQQRGEYVHVVAEAMKLAFADRAYWLGDPDFAPVPRGLIDRSYAQQLAARINRSKVSNVAGQGTPPEAASNLFEKHTTHVAAADAEGNWVALTTTVNTSFGSKVIVPGTGVVLNNEMDDFSIQPGVRNAFGLVGAEANAVGPGKRPLSSMSPTIVLRDGAPVFTVGAAGGPTIISQVLLAILGRIDLDMPLDEVVGQSRFHQQWSPDELRVESNLPAEVKADLERRGHRLNVVSRIGVTQAILWDPSRGLFVGAHDPRVPGLAAGP